MDNHCLFFRSGNSQILVPQPFSRSKIISARNLINKPHDSIFFRSKNNTSPTSTSPALILSSLSNCFSTTFTVGHSQKISARRLISSTTTLAHHGRISSALSPSSDNDHDHQAHKEHKSKMAKISSSSPGASTASLAFNCVLGILCCGSMIEMMLPNKATAVYNLPSGIWSSGRTGHKSTTVPEPGPDAISPLSGISVVEGFLHGVLYLTFPKNVTLYDLPMFYNEDVLEDKKQAFNLIKSGKSGEALELLESKRVKAHPELKYYYEMHGASRSSNLSGEL